jgi:hypothetical protein
VAGFYWFAGVGNGSVHLFTPSSVPFVCITKPGRFSKPGSPGIFHREHVTTAFYTRSGGLRAIQFRNYEIDWKLQWMKLKWL